ncbi:VWA domain-containing protein [Streptomyces sp. ACA25]|uniref:vWA domain-containing protein n=1 Tax=Streptomyces sp. ACA25 TaxID=3022596 RepID=UPI00230786DC|nr:VWA domain-containing protein [Streptomyces sp. ACA25]MDB1086269.1 VWA domain-containing protein [Streptomyces sp. ACA25]
MAGGLAAALLLGALPAAAAPTAAPATGEGVAGSNSSLIMVLDASGSMAEDDGTGSTRMAAAQEALGTAVDALPEGHPTGLRLYGSESSSCTDTRLAQPVEAVDPEAIKEALGEVGPTGNTPTSLALEKAAEDLPEVPHGAIGRQTVLLISDGESNCEETPPCEVAAELVGNGVDVRIDTVGFQISDEGREELECIAEAGHGTYYDAPDGEALGRELERAALLSADGYRFEGEEISGGSSSDEAAVLEPGQYLDTLGPGETRWYAAELDDASAADFSVTAVPHPGVAVDSRDTLELQLTDSRDSPRRCGTERIRFGDDEGAMILTQAVSRIPSAEGTATCDEAGRYLLSVSRESAETSDRAHWPMELRFALEEPLEPGSRPAASTPDYGRVGADHPLPADEPEDITGGTGFNDATELDSGVWRDRLLPAQTRYYKVPVGWGQQLRYRVEFGNEPTLEGRPPASYVRTRGYSPTRQPIARGDFRTERPYRGEQLAVDMGTVPVSWTNRWESGAEVRPVRRGGDYYLAVSLGPGAVEIAQNAAIGVVIRVDVAGAELSGPEHQAPVLGEDGEAGTENDDDSVSAGDNADSAGAGWTGPVLAAAGGAAAVLLLTALAFALAGARARRRAPAGPGSPGEGGSGGNGGNGGGGLTRSDR